MFGDEVLGATNLRMIEAVRSTGAAAKFTGSGGAVLAYCPEGEAQVQRLAGVLCQKPCVFRENGHMKGMSPTVSAHAQAAVPCIELPAACTPSLLLLAPAHHQEHLVRCAQVPHSACASSCKLRILRGSQGRLLGTAIEVLFCTHATLLCMPDAVHSGQHAR